MALEAIRYQNGKLQILDQLLLPHETKYTDIKNCQDGWRAIHDMQVRGAPAIAIVGILSLAVDLYDKIFTSVDELCLYVNNQLDYLVSARPTAVNMADARNKLCLFLNNSKFKDEITLESLKMSLIMEIEKMKEDDVAINIELGRFGADDIENKNGDVPLVILTHCNTGSLATAGYGTALGVVRTLHERKKLVHCFFTETRPYNQGSRLTAYELVHDRIPATLICDDMVGALMLQHEISAVVTGADRVVANGDTANKIGTYQIAILAKYHGVPFYIAAPSSSIDLQMKSGKEIVIEERSHQEMTTLHGIKIAAEGIACWNPAFDITPADLITGGIITEYGVFKPDDLENFFSKLKSK